MLACRPHLRHTWSVRSLPLAPVPNEVDWFLSDLSVARGASPNTVSNYRRDLARYSRFIAARQRQPETVDELQIDWNRVSAQDVEQHLLRLAQGDDEQTPLAPSSVARALAAVRTFHKWLVRESITGVDPASDVKTARLPSNLPKALTVGQIEALILAARQGEDPVSLRDVALLEFLYATGARVSEAVSVSSDDVELAEPISVVRLFGKGRKERLVPFGRSAQEALDAYIVRARPVLAARGRGQVTLFLNRRGAPLSRQSAWEIIDRAASRAGIGEAVSPHTLRHSFATHMLEGGASVREVQELLGHASVSTTQIYTKLSAQVLAEVYRSTHPRAR